VQQSRFLHETKKKSESYILELGGRSIKRYYLNKCEDNYLDYSAELYTKPDFTFFNDERVVIREIVSNGLVCSLANDTVLFNKSCYVVKSKNPNFNNKYLLGLLNSKLIGYFVVNTGDKSKQNLFPRVSMRTLKSLPIINVELEKQQPFITLVEQIMQLKQQGQPTIALETQIDNMVYALYGLTDQEIAIIEGK
jgi:restriction endonuclease S subunit